MLAYALVLVAMAWTAFGAWRASAAAGALLAALGALLFVASDSTLALERFTGRHPWGQPLVLATYFSAQGLIALSVAG